MYKALEYETNYGYQIFNYNTDSTATASSYNESISTRNLAEVYSVEVVIENTSNNTSNVYTDVITLNIGGRSYQSVIPTTSATRRTVTFNITDVLTGSAGSNVVSIGFNGNTRTTLKSIKIYYK